jgi:rSAM/selenodomain-associated transferase 2
MNGLSGTRWWSWPRAGCLLVTAGILTFIFRRLDAGVLRESLAHIHIGWFTGAFCAYGLALLLGGLRWHVTLQAIGRAVHVGASVRLAFIGHFLFLILFSGAAGDVAKAALYARRYRFGVPELAASTPLDRALGAFAAIFVGTAAALAGFFSGGFESLRPGHIHVSRSWMMMAGAGVAATVMALAFWKPRGETWWARGWGTLRCGTRNFVSSRRQFTRGLLLAVFVQLALSGVFALNVRAVAGGSLPWLKLAWTFPVVTMLSCLPVSVAGAGVREMLSLAFLGLYGVPPGDCVGAAALTFACKVSWALAGGAVLWREAAVQERCAAFPSLPQQGEDGKPEATLPGTVTGREPKTISVIVPVLNEAESLPSTIEHVRRNSSIHEIIVVDGGSIDRTPEIAEQLGCRLLTSRPGRGGQMRAGAAVATGDVILLLHADTWLPPHATRALLDCLRDGAVVAGGFWKEFRDSPWLLLGSKWKCAIRLWIGRRIVGDQAMFIRRAALEATGGVPDMALMEDFALCQQLRRVGRIALADAIVLTSARRFEKRGVIRTYLRMWRVATQYRMGAAPGELRKLYERE